MKSASANAQAKKSLVFHWFRLGDMRLHDNPSLHKSILQAGNDNILPVFCFDPRIFGNDARSRLNEDELKVGPKRAQFVLESVADLRASLERKGSGLLVAHGKPEDFLSQLFQQLGKDVAMTHGKVICQREVCSEEQKVVKAVETALHNACCVSGITRPKSSLVETVWGSTLYNLEDLPYQPGLTDFPDGVS
jgi:deoxyribodipyrimidine photo-lyase